MSHADRRVPWTAWALIVVSVVTLAAPARADAVPGRAPESGARAPKAVAAAAAPTAAAPLPAAPAPSPPSAPAAPPPQSDAAPAAAPPPPAAQAPAPPDDARDEDPRALEEWKPRLDAYGTWADDSKYGRVWVPDRGVVGEGFSPYVSSGHWALDTENNWVWVSDFEFGDIVFHYGRWVWTDYGWAWVPGYRYSPAWVVWRVPTGPYAYVGWAPAPPTFVWWSGIAVGIGYPPPYYWVFCPSMYVFAPYPYYYVVTSPRYVHTLGRYTRYYVPASPRVTGPTLAAARVPRSATPTRLSAASTVARGADVTRRAGPYPTQASPGRAAPLGRSFAAERANPGLVRASAPRSVAERAPPRVAPPRVVYAPRSSGPGPRAVAPSSGGYAPSVRPAPGRVYAPSRSYAPSAAPSRSYPAPRVYSPPRSYSAPRVYSPPSRVYSAPRGSPSHGVSPHRR